MAQHGGHAHLGFQLVHDGEGHRALSAGDPARGDDRTVNRHKQLAVGNWQLAISQTDSSKVRASQFDSPLSVGISFSSSGRLGEHPYHEIVR